MSSIFKLIFICIISLSSFAREIGETEITTDDGIEVFQNEQYYLLKKNVKIESDNFTLNADNVKIDFENNLNDITELNAEGTVKFSSSEFNLKGKGDKLKFEVRYEKLEIRGSDSELITENIEMFSNGLIKVNNLTGEFSLLGKNSKLINENIIIIGESIEGVFSNNSNNKEITFLNVFDSNLSYVKNDDSEMYAKKINYDDETALIELIDDVAIIRDGEKIVGDYGTLDTKNNSYKIKSSKKSKVKAIIINNEQ